MKANEINLDSFFSQNKTQFVIPVYQRNYDWKEQQCKQLIDDIIEAGSNDKLIAHFIGSIVYIHDDVYSASKIKELTIIDGQQRLTTITLIYIALYRHAKNLGMKELEQEILETYLINKFAQEDDRIKLKLTENNDKTLKFLLNEENIYNYPHFSRLFVNYNLLDRNISEFNIDVIRRGLRKIMFVEISLERDKDDPQRIFESLNSTGLELSQADLIRNYILMGQKKTNQNRLYNQYWKPIQKYAHDETTNINKVSDFVRDYLTFLTKKIPNKNKVYVEFKEQFPIGDYENLAATLEEIKKFSSYYYKLINPGKESDKDLSMQLKYISRLEINVAYPFLMKVYDDYSSGVIDKNTIVKVLELVQSFTFRRFIVGLPTNALNKIFMRLYEDIDYNNYLGSIEKSLMKKKGIQRFPRDNEVVNSLKEKDVYNIKPKNRVYLLERLENHENRERVQIEDNPDFTIEHIFPRKPDEAWKWDLQDDFHEMQETYLHTIANLTLSAYNGNLGNKEFIKKRDLIVDGKEYGYSYSKLWLNTYLKTIDRWSLSELLQRFEIIKERFLNIWKLPEDVHNHDVNFQEVNIFDADDPTNKKLEYAILFDVKYNFNEISKLYAEVYKILFDINPEPILNTEVGRQISITSNAADLRQAIQINDSFYIEGNLDSRGKFERIKKALTLYDAEEELTIKYLES